jgi:hypothetical protein
VSTTKRKPCRCAFTARLLVVCCVCLAGEVGWTGRRGRCGGRRESRGGGYWAKMRVSLPFWAFKASRALLFVFSLYQIPKPSTPQAHPPSSSLPPSLPPLPSFRALQSTGEPGEGDIIISDVSKRGKKGGREGGVGREKAELQNMI